MAIISSFQEKNIPEGVVFIGEVGLAGELRRVNNINLRLKEVERVGFDKCIIPKVNLKEVDKKFQFQILEFDYVKEVYKQIFK